MGSHQSRDLGNSDAQINDQRVTTSTTTTTNNKPPKAAKNGSSSLRSPGGSLTSSGETDAVNSFNKSSSSTTSYYRSFRFLSPKSLVSPRAYRSPSAVNGFPVVTGDAVGDLSASEVIGARMANPQGGGGGEKVPTPTTASIRGGFGFRGGHGSGGGSSGGGSSPGISKAKELSRSPNPQSGRGRGQTVRGGSKPRSQLAPPGGHSSTSSSQQQSKNSIPCASVESLNDNESSPTIDNQSRRFGFRNNNNAGNISSNNNNPKNDHVYLANNKNNAINNNSRSTDAGDGPIAVIETPSTTGLVSASSSSSKTKSIPSSGRGRSRLLGPGAFGRSSNAGASPALASTDNDNAASKRGGGMGGGAGGGGGDAATPATDNFHYPPHSPKLRTKPVVEESSSSSAKAKAGKGQSGGIGKMKNSGFGFRYDGIKSRLMPPNAASRSATPPVKSPNEKIRKDLISKVGGGGGGGATAAATAAASNEARAQSEQQQRRLSVSPVSGEERAGGGSGGGDGISSRPCSQPPSAQSTRRATGNHFSIDGLNFIDASSSEDFVSIQSSNPGSPKILPKSPVGKTLAFAFNNNNFVEDKAMVDKAFNDALEKEKIEEKETTVGERIDDAAVQPELPSRPMEEQSEPASLAEERGDKKDEKEEDASVVSAKEDDEEDADNIEIVDPDSPIPKTNLNLSLQSYSLEEDVETPLAPPSTSDAPLDSSTAPVALLESSFVESVSSRTASPFKNPGRINVKLDELLRIEGAVVVDDSAALKDDRKSAAVSSSETDDNADLGKGSSLEEEEEGFASSLHKRRLPRQRNSEPQRHPRSSLSDSDFVESESISGEEAKLVTAVSLEEEEEEEEEEETSKREPKSSAEVDQVSVASHSSNNIQEMPDVETLSSCSLDSNDLMLDVDHSIDDLDGGSSRKDSYARAPPQRILRPEGAGFGGVGKGHGDVELPSADGDIMTYNEEGGGDGHVLEGLEDIKEELDLLQKSLDLSASSGNTASYSPVKKASIHHKPSNGGLMDSHPSVWSSSKVSLSNKEESCDREAVDGRSSASPVLKSRCASVSSEVGRTASPSSLASCRAAGGRSLSAAAASASPRHPMVGVTPKLRPPRTLPLETDMEGMAFVIDGVTYRRSLQDVISMKTMLLKLKRILQQDEFTSTPFTPVSSPSHLRTALPWAAAPCSSCGNPLMQQIQKTPVSKRHSAHFPVQETPRILDDATTTTQQPKEQSVDVSELVAENQELRNQMSFLCEKISEKDRTIALLQQQMVKYAQQGMEEETDDQN